MLSRLNPGVAILSLLLVLVSTSAGAVPVVDQDGLIPDVGGDDQESGFFLAPTGTAQSFTSGLTGLLTRIDIQVRQTVEGPPSAPLLFDIRRSTSTGAPVEDDSGSDVLASIALNAAAIPTQPFTLATTTIDLTSFSIFVEAGDVLAIALRSDDSRAYSTTGISNSYSDGSIFFRFADGWERDLANRDFGFQTFVDSAIQNPNPSTVSEPATFALLTAGLAGLGALTRRRRRRAPL
jgi:hypothetical protein